MIHLYWWGGGWRGEGRRKGQPDDNFAGKINYCPRPYRPANSISDLPAQLLAGAEINIPTTAISVFLCRNNPAAYPTKRATECRWRTIVYFCSVSEHKTRGSLLILKLTIEGMPYLKIYKIPRKIATNNLLQSRKIQTWCLTRIFIIIFSELSILCLWI